MLISMSEIDAVKWSDQGVNGLLPTGTVTLLWADIEGSTRLWETLPEEMTAAVENLDRTLADLVGVHRGASRRAGRGRQLCGGLHPCIRRGGVCAGITASAAIADPVAHWSAHRRGAVAR